MPIIDLRTLTGSNGFRIIGVSPNFTTTSSVSSAGDVNGDGIDDIIIGSALANPQDNANAGQTFVIFGTTEDFTADFDLSTLNGLNGFSINGANVNDRSGISVSSAGDINGDGIDDILIGAHLADPNGSDVAGQSYVVFGSNSGFDTNIDLNTLNGANGFSINGIAAGDLSGFSVSSAGDVNGDGIDDIIIGAVRADPNGVFDAGQSFIIFGNSNGFSASLDLSDLNGTNGFIINGVNEGDLSGRSVSSAGDVNGDGIDDIIIGAPNSDFAGNNSGQSYVIFGSTNQFPINIELATLNGNNGFVINGVSDSDQSGFSVSSAGDINGDGIDDLVIGASGTTVNGVNLRQSHIIFGDDNGFSANVDLADLDGTNGFTIHGINTGNGASGILVSSAGDVNGDGFDDLIIGSPSAGIPDIDGQSFVVFGSDDGFPASFNLADLNGINGFTINGVDSSEGTGAAVSSAGDINGDGFDDLIIRAAGATLDGMRTGASFVIFGSATLGQSATPTNGADVLAGTEADDTLSGLGGFDTLFGLGGDDTLDGGTGADSLEGGDGDDLLLGGTNRDTLLGGAGDDTLDGQGSFDLIFGDDGNDLIEGGAGGDTLFGGAGDDTITGGINGADVANGDAGNDLISGGSNFDTLNGGTGNDTLNGDLGADSLSGDDGNDSLFGGTNLDRLEGGRGNDTLDGGGAADFLSGGAQSDLLFGEAGDDTLNGDQGADTIIGGNGADILDGGTGNDSLDGGTNRDTLFGSLGDDTLTGGGAADTFVFEDGDAGNHLITDFDVTSAQVRQDILDFSDVTDITDFNDLINNHLDVSAGTISYGSTVITLSGTDLSLLTADNFLF